jgi:hypothetical protein
MAGKHFINQFKNTRRLACLLGRRPPGGQANRQARMHFGKTQKTPRLEAKRTSQGRRGRKLQAGKRG